MEIWKDVVGYEGIYQVSNLGRVKSVEGKVTYSTRHGKRSWKERILRQKTDKGGYKRVELYKEKKNKTWLVHRLVCEAFLEKENGNTIVNHIDANPSNNRVGNLEWCDYTHNNNHAFDNGLIPSKRTTLENIETGETFDFRSMAKASEFLGSNPGYVSGLLKRNKTIIKGYHIKVG